VPVLTLLSALPSESSSQGLGRGIGQVGVLVGRKARGAQGGGRHQQQGDSGKPELSCARAGPGRPGRRLLPPVPKRRRLRPGGPGPGPGNLIMLNLNLKLELTRKIRNDFDIQGYHRGDLAHEHAQKAPTATRKPLSHMTSQCRRRQSGRRVTERLI
jgi:hypothetical protein